MNNGHRDRQALRESKEIRVDEKVRLSKNKEPRLESKLESVSRESETIKSDKLISGQDKRQDRSHKHKTKKCMDEELDKKDGKIK